jgi:hypothetical protein
MTSPEGNLSTGGRAACGSEELQLGGGLRCRACRWALSQPLSCWASLFGS